MDIKKIINDVNSRRDQMVQDLVAMSSIPAVNPKSNGTGEYERMMWLIKIFDDYSIPYKIYETEDEKVKEKKRLNVVVKISGTEKTEKTVWFISHLDTVPAGDLKQWNSDPYVPLVKDGRVYGRGTEDNGQAVICSLHTCLLMIENNIRAKCNIGFMFVSDEETGSDYGLKVLVNEGIFHDDDEAIVPDAGNSNGSFVEIAEKSMVWLKFTVLGKQAHASMPHLGINASSVSCHFAVELEELLREKYSFNDELFDPPYSSFEITQKFQNVESPNILPGKDEFVMDMRILPMYKVDDVMQDITKLITKYENKYNVKINYEFLNRVDAPKPTSIDSTVVVNIVKSISERGITPKVGGIGGGTCAAIVREIGIPAVVWSTVDELAHQPNEYAVIDNLITDTQVFISTVLKYA